MMRVNQEPFLMLIFINFECIKKHIPMDEDLEEKTMKLVTQILLKKPVELSHMQRVKFEQLCFNIIRDNPNNDISTLLPAGNIALNMIISFPDLTP